MPGQDWSDRQIEQYAKRLAPKIRAAGRSADNEAELRLNVNPLLKRFAEHASLDLDETHERLIGRGRADSVYGRVVIEYEPPRSLHDRNSARANAHAIKQVQDYIEDTCKRDAQDLGRFVGVVLDGDRIIFVHHRRGDWDVGPARDVDADSVADLLLRLRALRGKALLPKNLVIDFGGQEARGKFEASAIARQNVAALYKALAASESPKVDALFAQWRLLFSEVCGYEFGSPKLDLEALAASYDVVLKKPARAARTASARRAGPARPAQSRTPHAEMLFFAIHTYYATVITLLAAEIVTFYTSDIMPSYLGKLEAASGPRLGRELRDLHETGGIFGQALVQNFLEGDFFGWYLEEWNDSIAAAVRAIIISLRQYDASTFQVEPDQTRDLLKKLYQYLLPKKLRHDLGEYYTPDWLAELVLNEVAYDGDLTKRILDPACGSGTFLALEIRRAREWARAKPWRDRETLDGILASIVGFDLNPLAVITARTNYLIALGDLLRHRRGPIEIPVYLCDAVQTPSEARQVDLLSGRGYPLETAVGTLRVPAGLATQRQIADLASLLEESVRGHYRTEEFLERAKRELGLSSDDYGQAEVTLSELYGKLCQVAAENRNGIWARIIKNFFAPVFAVAERKFDYLAGNLPWIGWESLPDKYRESTKRLWEDYGLFTLKGWQARMGGGKKDLSALFFYVAADRYLASDGRLGFLITESLFKTSGAGEGFRRLELPAEPGRERAGIGVLTVHDLVDVQPFEGASNRTAVVAAAKGTATRYPVPYVVWRRRDRERPKEDSPLAEATDRTVQLREAARPITARRGSPWITGPIEALSAVDKLIGRASYAAYAGLFVGAASAVYWVRLVEAGPGQLCLVENMWESGKNTGVSSMGPVRAVVEKELLFPLLRNRDAKRWRATPSAHIIVPHDPATGTVYDEGTLRVRFPHAYAYFARFREELVGRRAMQYKGVLTQGKRPFYWICNTVAGRQAPVFSRAKVVWPQMVPDLAPAVLISTGRGRTTVPQHIVTIVPLSEPGDAHFVCSTLASRPARFVAARYSTGKSFGAPHVLQHIKVPRFDSANAVHLRLCELSQAAHEAAARADDKRVAEIEAQVDEAAAELWGLTPKELAIIQKALREK
jgi:SAM-dependent methyltransferase